MYCCVAPLAIDAFPGVTEIDTSAAAVTVSVVVPEIVPEVALIVVEPVLAALARPAVVIVATVTLEELQVAVLVKFCVVLSLYVPVAVNCSVVPLAIEEFAGVTAIDTSVTGAGFTVSVADIVPPLNVAEICAVAVEATA